MSFIYTNKVHDHMPEGCWRHPDVAEIGTRCTQGDLNNTFVQRSLRRPECRKSAAMLARCVSQVVNMGPSSMHTCPGLPPVPPDNARNNLPYPNIKRSPIQGPERAA